ncbi:MAG: UbiX family flavin prenyltransferase [Chloroflexota bacterium]|nr:UbiX family flavin prenyltransferase [Chloroflexota bacterium]
MTDDITHKKTMIIAITGASGSILASKTIDALLSRNMPTAVVASNPARIVWRQEMDESFGEAIERWSESRDFTNYAIGDIQSPIASGTYPTMGMAVVPSSMATVSAIANGISDNLARRAADVCLKERKPLVIVPRESPLNNVHLTNLAKVSSYGATVIPSDPPFYLPINTLEESAGFTSMRILLALGVITELPKEMQYRGKYN